MGQVLDKVGDETPLYKMCRDNPKEEERLRRLSGCLNKKLGNDDWPLGGTWDLDKCTKMEEAIWKRDAGNKWKILMSSWRKKANELNEESKLASWRGNARKRGISECHDEGIPKTWVVLKWECEKYEQEK